jgi:hypothetical protein
MPIKIVCPHCGQDLRLPDHLYERPAQCPFCDGAFKVQWPRRREANAGEPMPVRSSVASDGHRPCRFCGEPIDQMLPKCPVCGENLDS